MESRSGTSERPKQPWKSGASAPRRIASKGAGFSPGGPQGLKAYFSRAFYAALEGPLFHGRGKTLARIQVACLAAGFSRAMLSPRSPPNAY